MIQFRGLTGRKAGNKSSPSVGISTRNGCYAAAANGALTMIYAMMPSNLSSNATNVSAEEASVPTTDSETSETAGKTAGRTRLENTVIVHLGSGIAQTTAPQSVISELVFRTPERAVATLDDFLRVGARAGLHEDVELAEKSAEKIWVRMLHCKERCVRDMQENFNINIPTDLGTFYGCRALLNVFLRTMGGVCEEQATILMRGIVGRITEKMRRQNAFSVRRWLLLLVALRDVFRTHQWRMEPLALQFENLFKSYRHAIFEDSKSANLIIMPQLVIEAANYLDLLDSLFEELDHKQLTKRVLNGEELDDETADKKVKNATYKLRQRKLSFGVADVADPANNIRRKTAAFLFHVVHSNMQSLKQALPHLMAIRNAEDAPKIAAQTQHPPTAPPLITFWDLDVTVDISGSRLFVLYSLSFNDGPPKPEIAVFQLAELWQQSSFLKQLQNFQ